MMKQTKLLLGTLWFALSIRDLICQGSISVWDCRTNDRVMRATATHNTPVTGKNAGKEDNLFRYKTQRYPCVGSVPEVVIVRHAGEGTTCLSILILWYLSSNDSLTRSDSPFNCVDLNERKRFAIGGTQNGTVAYFKLERKEIPLLHTRSASSVVAIHSMGENQIVTGDTTGSVFLHSATKTGWKTIAMRVSNQFVQPS